MADKKKEEVPEHISKYKKLSKKAEQMIHTMERHHRGAYDKALDDVLTRDGQVDMELLENQENQEKFANKMADHYISKAKQMFKTKDDAKFDDLEKELLINAYAGTTKAQLRQIVKSAGKGFTFDLFYNHEEMRPKMMENIKQKLGTATIGHFDQKHIGDIVKYIGASKFVDDKKMTLQDAIHLLGEYEHEGAVSAKKHQKALYYKK